MCGISGILNHKSQIKIILDLLNKMTNGVTEAQITLVHGMITKIFAS